MRTSVLIKKWKTEYFILTLGFMIVGLFGFNDSSYAYEVPGHLPDKECKYVIITTSEFREYFKPLIIERRAAFRDAAPLPIISVFTLMYFTE